nr:hypothetical protein [Tanacetum cinerariifolium]
MCNDNISVGLKQPAYGLSGGGNGAPSPADGGLSSTLGIGKAGVWEAFFFAIVQQVSSGKMTGRFLGKAMVVGSFYNALYS